MILNIYISWYTMKIITSPFNRVKETIKAAYESSTWESINLNEQPIEFINSYGKVVSWVKKSVYSNLLWGESLAFAKVLSEYKKVYTEIANDPANKDVNPLVLQDRTCELFLSWKFESGNPYTFSKERVKLLSKWFDKLDSQNEVKILAMRHGHKKWENLTETWVQEAQQAGRDFEFWSQDMIVGTHQLVIESILISLIWWSQWLSPQQAWEVLPQGRQEPYRTAQVTEFMFTKNGKWEKMMTVKTNNYEKSFSEEEVIKAYKHLKQTLI